MAEAETGQSEGNRTDGEDRCQPSQSARNVKPALNLLRLDNGADPLSVEACGKAERDDWEREAGDEDRRGHAHEVGLDEKVEDARIGGQRVCECHGEEATSGEGQVEECGSCDDDDDQRVDEPPAPHPGERQRDEADENDREQGRSDGPPCTEGPTPSWSAARSRAGQPDCCEPGASGSHGHARPSLSRHSARLRPEAAAAAFRSTRPVRISARDPAALVVTLAEGYAIRSPNMLLPSCP